MLFTQDVCMKPPLQLYDYICTLESEVHNNTTLLVLQAFIDFHHD